MTMTRPTSEQVTFLAAGIGATQRLAVDKFRDVVSVKDFGAVGDGTTDDTAAVQAAIAAASSVWFPAGTYIVRNVTVGSGKTLMSDRSATIKLKQLASLDFSPCFNVTGNDVMFFGMRFDGNRAVQPADGFSDSWNTGANGTGKSNRAAILMDGVPTTTLSGLRVEQCEFTKFYAGSVVTRSVNDVCIRDCVFKESNLEGCFLYSFGSTRTVNASVTGCSFKSLYSGDPSVEANCIALSLYVGAIVSNNYGDDCGRNLVKLEFCEDVIIDSNLYSNNRVANFNAMQAQGECHNLVFSNNVLRSVGHGFQVSSNVGTMTNIVIDGNVIEDITGTAGTPDGIVLQNVSGVTITNNTIRNAFRFGIYAAVVFGNVVISSNIVTNTGGSGVAGPAIFVGPNAGTTIDSLVIEGNMCAGHQMVTNGIISIQQGSGAAATIAALVLSNNTLIGVGATNNRGMYSTTGIVFTRGIVSGNVSDAIDQFVVGAGSGLSFRNNVSASLLAPDTTMGRAIPAASAIPSSGTFQVGDVVFHSAPAPSGNIGWVCTTAGSPGTWKAFGTISA
jgi:parallel beta-helix repeat protein